MTFNNLIKIDGIQITRDQLSELFPSLPVLKEDGDDDDMDEYEEKFNDQIYDLINQWCVVLDDKNKIINEEGWFYDENSSEVFYLKNNMKCDLNEHKKAEVYKFYFSQKKKVRMCKWCIIVVDKNILNLEGIRKVKRIELYTPLDPSLDELNKFFIGFITKFDIHMIFATTPQIKILDTSKFDLSHFKQLFPNFTDSVIIDSYLSTDDCTHSL